MNGGICTLTSVFRTAFPGVTYSALNASAVCSLCIGAPSSGTSEVMEHFQGVQYSKLIEIFKSVASKNSAKKLSMTKEEMKQLPTPNSSYI